MARLRTLVLVVLVTTVVSAPAAADVTRVSIASRTVVANGQWFGAAGPYEKITGTVFFELDPAEQHNRAITDIDLAPRNARGRVEFSADLFILTPQDPARASGSVLFEISNRGNKGSLTTFNRATASAARPTRTITPTTTRGPSTRSTRAGTSPRTCCCRSSRRDRD